MHHFQDLPRNFEDLVRLFDECGLFPSSDMIPFLDLEPQNGSIRTMASYPPVKDIDQNFARKRARSRREDSKALSTGKVTPAELQRRNSILPDDFWDKSEIDWDSLAVGKKTHS